MHFANIINCNGTRARANNQSLMLPTKINYFVKSLKKIIGRINLDSIFICFSSFLGTYNSKDIRSLKTPTSSPFSMPFTWTPSTGINPKSFVQNAS